MRTQFLVGFQVRECPDHELWLDGRPVPVEPFAAGCTSFYDLKSDPIAYMRGTLSRAFRQSIGLPPHQWLLQRRVDKAKHCCAIPAARWQKWRPMRLCRPESLHARVHPGSRYQPRSVAARP